MSEQTVPPEFSRPIQLQEIERDGTRRRVEATAAECEALARRFGIVAVGALVADLVVRRLADRPVITIQGRLSARVTQECVVSLESFESEIDQEIDERFVQVDDDIGQIADTEEDSEFDEPLESEVLDLGEIVAQCLSLALDPYPRREGAELDLEGTDSKAAGPDGPFASLADLKRGST